MSEPAVSVLCETVCELGEGPSYEAETQTLYWFDIVASRLHSLHLASHETNVLELPFLASAIARVDDEKQLFVTEHGLHLRNRQSGEWEVLCAAEEDNPQTRSNDARVHPSGAIWFGTMGKNAEDEAGAIYWYRAGELRQLYPRITIPNSICFSPDGAIAYFADTRTNRMYRVACNPDTGLPVDEPILTVEGNEMVGGIDGSVCDAEGTVWNARWGGARLDAWSPDGQFLRSVTIPARQATCPVFIGDNAERLAVTSAAAGLDEAARGADPEAGKLFLIDMPVNGRLDPAVVI